MYNNTANKTDIKKNFKSIKDAYKYYKQTMGNYWITIKNSCTNALQRMKIKNYLQIGGLVISFVTGAVLLISNKGISIDININQEEVATHLKTPKPTFINQNNFKAEQGFILDDSKSENVQNSKIKNTPQRKRITSSYTPNKKLPTAVRSNNLHKEINELPLQFREKYVNRFINVAIKEMEQYHIPASIQLGIMILNSNYGSTTLAKKYNNHFNLLCIASTKTEGVVNEVKLSGNCYHVYQSAWSNFRAHSLYINQLVNPKQINKKQNYKDWIQTLKMANYPFKHFTPQLLKNTIEQYQLYKLDK